MEPRGRPIGAAGIQAQRFASDRKRRFASSSASQSDAGRTVPAETRLRLEPRLGFDLSRARIHTGPDADEASRALDAEAFTIGSDVYFAQGRFDPATARGTRLLAHELAHVRQQTVGNGRPIAARQAAGGGTEGAADDDRLIRPGVQAPAPSMKFAIRPPEPTMATPPPPSETGSKGGGDAKADPRAVADQVYELMKKEFELGRQRGLTPSRRRRR